MSVTPYTSKTFECQTIEAVHLQFPYGIAYSIHEHFCMATSGRPLQCPMKESHHLLTAKSPPAMVGVLKGSVLELLLAFSSSGISIQVKWPVHVNPPIWNGQNMTVFLHKTLTGGGWEFKAIPESSSHCSDSTRGSCRQWRRWWAWRRRSDPPGFWPREGAASRGRTRSGSPVFVKKGKKNYTFSRH